jgi:hypothetical protein
MQTSGWSDLQAEFLKLESYLKPPTQESGENVDLDAVGLHWDVIFHLITFQIGFLP